MCEDGGEVVYPGIHELLWEHPVLQGRSLKLLAAVEEPTQSTVQILSQFFLMHGQGETAAFCTGHVAQMIACNVMLRLIF